MENLIEYKIYKYCTISKIKTFITAFEVRINNMNFKLNFKLFINETHAYNNN